MAEEGSGGNTKLVRQRTPLVGSGVCFKNTFASFANCNKYQAVWQNRKESTGLGVERQQCGMNPIKSSEHTNMIGRQTGFTAVKQLVNNESRVQKRHFDCHIKNVVLLCCRVLHTPE